MNAKRAYYTLVFTLAFFGVAFAQLTSLQQALTDLCNALHGLIPIAAMLMVVLASVIYATGQMMGAETRARANVWATSCLTGALIGLLISSVAPPILGMLYNGEANSIAC
jgi:hypothetical protein